MVFSSDDVKISKLQEMEGALKRAFNIVRDELDDHREAINQNTNETQANYEYLCKLDSKIEKLAERIDEITLFIRQLKGQEPKKYVVSRLTRKEQEVFLVIYTSEDDINYRDIGRRLGLTEELVNCYVENLIMKGVPIIKKYINNELFINLDKDFKAIQAKENLLQITETIGQSVSL